MPRERKLINRLKPSKLTQISQLLIPFSARQTANISITISSRTIILNRTKIQELKDQEFLSFLRASKMLRKTTTPQTLLTYIKGKVLVRIKPQSIWKQDHKSIHISRTQLSISTTRKSTLMTR